MTRGWIWVATTGMAVSSISLPSLIPDFSTEWFPETALNDICFGYSHLMRPRLIPYKISEITIGTHGFRLTKQGIQTA
jgi:hypothetical protein